VRKSGFSLSIYLFLGLVTCFVLEGCYHDIFFVVAQLSSPRKACLEATKTIKTSRKKEPFFGTGRRKVSFVYSELAVGSLLSIQEYMAYTEVCTRYRLHKNIY